MNHTEAQINQGGPRYQICRYLDQEDIPRLQGGLLGHSQADLISHTTLGIFPVQTEE